MQTKPGLRRRTSRGLKGEACDCGCPEIGPGAQKHLFEVHVKAPGEEGPALLRVRVGKGHGALGSPSRSSALPCLLGSPGPDVVFRVCDCSLCPVTTDVNGKGCYRYFSGEVGEPLLPALLPPVIFSAARSLFASWPFPGCSPF